MVGGSSATGSGLPAIRRPPAEMEDGATSLDWPLSREEKKACLIRLYDHDLHTANNLVKSGQDALQALQSELVSIQTSKRPVKEGSVEDKSSTEEAKKEKGKVEEEEIAPKSRALAVVKQEADNKPLPPSTVEQAERLQRVILEATAALRGLLSANSGEDDETSLHGVEPEVPARRSKSEPVKEAKPMGSALRRDIRRHSRDGKPLKVSFSREETESAGSEVDVVAYSDDDYATMSNASSISTVQQHGEPEPDPGSLPQQQGLAAHASDGSQGSSGCHHRVRDAGAQATSDQPAVAAVRPKTSKQRRIARQPASQSQRGDGVWQRGQGSTARGRAPGTPVTETARQSKQTQRPRGTPIMGGPTSPASLEIVPSTTDRHSAAPPPSSFMDNCQGHVQLKLVVALAGSYAKWNL